MNAKICFLSTLVLVAACSAPTASPPSELPAEKLPGRLQAEIDGDQISLEIKGGTVPLIDFVRMAQEISGRVFVYERKDLEGTRGVSFIGQVQLERDTFFSFFQTMLYMQGIACVPGSAGEEPGREGIVKLVKMEKSG